MIALAYDNTDQRGDLVRGTGNMETDEGLETAVTVSLFTDARAQEGDDVDPGADKRGWWGTQYLDPPADELGSRLWQLRRGKLTTQGLAEAADIVREALQWFVDDGIASEVVVLAELMTGRSDVALFSISIQRPRLSAPRFERRWEVQFDL